MRELGCWMSFSTGTEQCTATNKTRQTKEERGEGNAGDTRCRDGGGGCSRMMRWRKRGFMMHERVEGVWV
jgi:hypothetical protein